MTDIIWHLDRDNQGNRKLKVVGSRLTDELEITYSLDDSGKCQPTTVSTDGDSDSGQSSVTQSTADNLEEKIKALLATTDGKLTTKEIMDSVSASQQAVNKALKNATWVRREKDGKTCVYWAEKTNLQPTTYNRHPIGELVVDAVVGDSKADIEPVPTDELESGCRSVVDAVVDGTDSQNVTDQSQPSDSEVLNDTETGWIGARIKTRVSGRTGTIVEDARLQFDGSSGSLKQNWYVRFDDTGEKGTVEEGWFSILP